MNVDNMFAQHTPTPAQKRRKSSLRCTTHFPAANRNLSRATLLL